MEDLTPVRIKWTVARDKTATAERCSTATKGNEAQPQPRRYHGWSAQEILHYNQLFDGITMIQTTPKALLFEDHLLRYFQHHAETRGNFFKSDKGSAATADGTSSVMGTT
jgi:hypothetical protein